MNKNKSVLCIILFLVLVEISASRAGDSMDGADFYIDFSECKMLVGFLVASDESLKVLDNSDGFLLSCNYETDAVTCQNVSARTKEVVSTSMFNIVSEPPLLHLVLKNGIEYISIDKEKHAASLVNVISRDQFLGAKVCQGGYFTADEMKSSSIK